MATSNVSAIDREEWQLITSAAATGTSVTFNAFSGYKHLWLTGKGITKSASDYILVRPNNNSTAGNYAIQYNDGNADKIFIGDSTATAQAVTFQIFDVDKTTPKKMLGSYDTSVPAMPMDAFVDTVAVTSLVISTNSGNSFTGGTFYLYGIVA